jgi:AcrR family transcriptional regulator
MPMPRLSGDAREEIKAAALDLFAAHGYEQTSLREVAQRLGISKAALYYHFSSKDDLLTALIEPLVHDQKALLDDVQSGAVSDPRAILERYFDVCLAHRRLFRAVVSNLQVLSRLDLIAQLIHWRTQLDEILVGPRPDDQVRAIVAFGGIQDCAVLFPDEFAVETVREAAVDAGLRALLPAGDPS